MPAAQSKPYVRLHEWAWRRKLESGETLTVHDITRAEKVTDRFFSRVMRLAYLSPDVLERLVISRDPPSVSVRELIEVTYLPWVDQMTVVFYPNLAVRGCGTSPF